MKKGLLGTFPFLLLACYTLTVPLEVDAPEELYFKRAQESFSYGDYKTAISVYELFLERHPHDMTNSYTARYEIGYIHYRARHYGKAKEHLTKLLSVPSGVPTWIPVLSRRVLDKIETKQKKSSKKITKETSEVH